jgi:uncharacterized protein with HEPN domain
MREIIRDNGRLEHILNAIANAIEFKITNNTIDWKAIIGLRHVLVHGYYHIAEERVWKIIQKDLLPFKEQIQILYAPYNLRTN